MSKKKHFHEKNEKNFLGLSIETTDKPKSLQLWIPAKKEVQNKVLKHVSGEKVPFFYKRSILLGFIQSHPES